MLLCRPHYWPPDKWHLNELKKILNSSLYTEIMRNCWSLIALEVRMGGLTERRIAEGLPCLCHHHTRYFSEVKPGLWSATVTKTVCAKCSGWSENSEASISDWRFATHSRYRAAILENIREHAAVACPAELQASHTRTTPQLQTSIPCIYYTCKELSGTGSYCHVIGGNDS